MNRKQDIEALLIERKGYVMRNLPKRIAAVDEALGNLNYDPESNEIETTAVEPIVERAVVGKNKRKR